MSETDYLNQVCDWPKPLEKHERWEATVLRACEIICERDRVIDAAIAAAKTVVDAQSAKIGSLTAERDALLTACKAARHVWSQGYVDRGFKDERNWIDDSLDMIDAAIALAEGGE